MEKEDINNFRIGSTVSRYLGPPISESIEIELTAATIIAVDSGLITVKPIKITEEKLIEYGFKDELVGGVGFSINYIDRHIALIKSDGVWYPQFIQEPEMSHEDRQIVSLPYIEYWHELEDLHKVLIGEELKNQKI